MKPKFEALIESWPTIAYWYTNFALVLAAFNAVSHLIIAVTMLRGGGKNVWEHMVPGRKFEVPGSGLKMLLSTVWFEWLAVIVYICTSLGTHGWLSHLVLCSQVWTMGGDNLYNKKSWAEPEAPEEYLVQLFTIESWFIIGIIVDSASLHTDIWDKYALLAVVKGGGYCWAWAVTTFLRNLGIAKFKALPPPPPEEEVAEKKKKKKKDIKDE